MGFQPQSTLKLGNRADMGRSPSQLRVNSAAPLHGFAEFILGGTTSEAFSYYGKIAAVGVWNASVPGNCGRVFPAGSTRSRAKTNPRGRGPGECGVHGQRCQRRADRETEEGRCGTL